MSQQIAIRLDEADLEALDAAVAAGRYPSRAAAVRAGIGEFVREQRNREIAEQYRRAYGAHPQEPWFAEASAHATGGQLVERSPSA
ncbi:MAG: ribbon-helix-helix domain-containing protein [Solirubrobacterales bacterium]